MRLLSRNKRGIELTINFVVMLVLGIAMLSGALVLTKNLFSKVHSAKAAVDSNTMNEIRNLIIDSDEPVVIYPGRKTIARKGDFVFGVGIQNLLTEGDDRFVVETKLKGGTSDCTVYKEDGGTETQIIDFCPQTIGGAPITINKRELETVPLYVEVPKEAEPGLYRINVCVCKGTSCIEGCGVGNDKPPNLYGNVQLIDVKVP